MRAGSKHRKEYHVHDTYTPLPPRAAAWITGRLHAESSRSAHGAVVVGATECQSRTKQVWQPKPPSEPCGDAAWRLHVRRRGNRKNVHDGSILRGGVGNSESWLYFSFKSPGRGWAASVVIECNL